MSALLTAAAIEVGKAAAKSIFKFWLKDSTLGEDISSSLIDLVGKRTEDAIARRKGNRQFEEIGDKISEEILPLLQSEGAHLDEGERNAVAIAVAETLNKSRLSRELLLERNLQPTELMQYVLAANPDVTSKNLLNQEATALYERTIKECCTYIIDIASQLPAFTEHTFGEILKREDLIIDRVGQVLDEMHKLREQLNPLRKADQFEIEYREAVARNLDVLQLIGTDVSQPSRRHKLSVAYITLSVARQQQVLSRVRNSSLKDLAEEEFLSEEAQDELLQEIVSVDTALTSSKRLLVRGLAGSGKTTLMQWIAVQAARKSFKGQLAAWNDCIPFYIRLRHYAQTKLPGLQAFPEFAAPLLVDATPDQWVRHKLRSGRVIVLIDGVDELSAAKREEVQTWLSDLVASFKDAYFIVTSRPHAIEDGWMHNEAFSSATLQDMEQSDVFSFIEHWHEAVKQELYTDTEKKELGPLAEHLKVQVKQVRPIRNLATNPLLCAMLCALNRDRRRQLPLNRIELYKACVSLLLERREKESHVDVSDYPALSESQKHRLLEDLAYWMVNEGVSEAAMSVVEQRFSERLANMPSISQETTGQGVRRLLVERTGIIREPTVGRIDFTHRTFQEFFAAHIAIHGDIAYLVSQAHTEQWREVIILAAGLAPQTFCEQLIHGLIKRGDEERELRYQLHLIAVSCLETAIELGAEVRAQVEHRLSQLVPPKNITDAKALAAAGEMAVKHLDKKRIQKKGSMPANICVACIRTLATIGGDAAFDMLEGYAIDSRETVVKELVKAWDKFDREAYAKRILSHMLENKSELRLERISSLEGIQYLTNLTRLSLISTPMSDMSDMSVLRNMMNLRQLTLIGNELSDTSNIGSLTNLTKLFLGAWLNDVSALEGLINLKELDIIYTDVSDISALAKLTNLTHLNLSDTQVGDVSALGSLTNLTDLTLANTHVIDVSALGSLTNLDYLSLSHTSVSEVSALGSLTNLTNLDLSGTPVSEVSALGSLTNLTNLDLSNTQVSDVSALGSLTNLTWLNLSNTQVSDVSALGSLTNLKIIR